jgi:hypothetical protein
MTQHTQWAVARIHTRTKFERWAQTRCFKFKDVNMVTQRFTDMDVGKGKTIGQRERASEIEKEMRQELSLNTFIERGSQAQAARECQVTTKKSLRSHYRMGGVDQLAPYLSHVSRREEKIMGGSPPSVSHPPTGTLVRGRVLGLVSWAELVRGGPFCQGGRTHATCTNGGDAIVVIVRWRR